MESGAGAHQSDETAESISSDWSAEPFLDFDDAVGKRRFVRLSGSAPMSIGRDVGCDLALPWDASVSRLHAQLDRVGLDWTLVDDGLSRNGTFLNRNRINGRRRLRDGDTFAIGDTSFRYHNLSSGQSQQTRVAPESITMLSLSPTQRQILVALCRTFKDDAAYATPASNQAIAGELYLSVDAVKSHLRALFHKFHIEDLPQNQKRAKLVERAFSLGLVSRREL